MAAPGPAVSIVIPTYRRAEYVRTCLDHVRRQTVPPDEVFVVDTSPDDLTEAVVAEFPEVRYLRSYAGRGTTATSRHLGYQASSGDIVAFLDDDAFAYPDWLAELLAPYADASVGAVGGRVLRGEPPVWHEDIKIGQLLDDGTLTGYFDADPGRVVDVDHLLGASMSVRRSVLVELGGIRDGYPGTCLREESDLCVRVGAAGHRVVFTPAAIVDHVAGPYNKGQRFDLRYDYFGQRNNLVFLARNYGFGSPYFRRFIGTSVRRLAEQGRDVAARRRSGEAWPAVGRGAAHIALRAVMVAAGTVTGIGAATVERRRDRTSGRRF